LPTREIQKFLREIYPLDVSPDLISKVTDAVMAEVTAWQAHLLEPMYPVVFFDALRVKIRDESVVRSKAAKRGSNVIPFFAFPPEVRRVLYTTTALESVHARVRTIIKTRALSH
jgi:transposase-like protein